MQKLFLTMLVALVAMTSCEKSDLGGSLSGETAMVTISAEAASATRAVATDDLTYYVEIYLGDEATLKEYDAKTLAKARYFKDSQKGNGFFEVELLTGQDYMVLAWADYAEGYYDTDNLSNVTIVEGKYKINTSDRDAFAGAEAMNVSKDDAIEMSLVRPFGRVNVTSTDDIPTGFEPATVAIKYQIINTTYNILTGKAGTPTDENTFTVIATEVIDVDEGEIYLSADYLLVSKDESATVAFKQTYYDSTEEDASAITSYTFSNIPIQPNYQTNVSGKILTDGGTITIDVTDEWAGEYLEGAKVFANAEEYNTYINSTNVAGDAEFVITSLVNGEYTLSVPATMEATSITITVEEIGSAVTLNVGDGSEYAGTVNLVTPLGTYLAKLDVDLPEAHVTFLGYATESYSNTSPTTFVVLSGSVIEKLTVEGGNAEIQPGATVNEIVTEDDATYTTSIQNTTTGDYYLTIQLALNSATEGDVIEVAAGEFTEAFTINKSVTIKGAKAGISGWERADSNHSDETVMTGIISFTSDSELEVVLDGIAFTTNNVSKTGMIYPKALKSLTLTNCVAYDLIECLVYSEASTGHKENLVFTNNYLVGAESTKTSGTHLFFGDVKQATITNNYFEKKSRAINIPYFSGTDYDEDLTQLYIAENTFYDLANYAIQTPYFWYGKVVIENNIFEKIYSQDDTGDSPDPDGSINIRGYAYTQFGYLPYSCDITGNSFKDVQHVFFIRTHDYSNGSVALKITDENQVNLSGNTITLNTTADDTYETESVFECNETGYTGTIDFSANTIEGYPEGKTISDYVVLNDGAYLKVSDDVTLPQSEYDLATAAIAAAVNNGETNISVTISETKGGTVTLPTATTETVVNIAFTGEMGTTEEVVIYGETFLGTVNVSANYYIYKMTIKVPEGNATFPSGSYGNVTVWTK